MKNCNFNWETKSFIFSKWGIFVIRTFCRRSKWIMRYFQFSWILLIWCWCGWASSLTSSPFTTLELLVILGSWCKLFSIYSIKITLLSSQLDIYSAEELKNIKDFALYVALFQASWYFKCPLASSAPLLHLHTILQMKRVAKHTPHIW